MALNTVSLPFGYYPDPTQGRPVFNGSIFIGEPDLDPTILANQKTITIRQEGVDTPSVPQPISTSAGGVPVFNGSPAEILVDGDHSLAVLNSQGSQVYYVANQTEPDLTYNQGGTGAVDTTVEAKLQETVSITDFGAVAGGSATTNATALIDAAAATTGVVEVPFGTFDVAATTSNSDTILGVLDRIECRGILNINLDTGLHSHTSEVVVNSPTATNIFVNGEATVSTTASSQVSVSGSAKNYSVIMGVASSVGISVNDYVMVRQDITGTGDFDIHAGVWKVTAIDSGGSNRLTLLNTCHAAVFPTNTLTGGAVVALKTRIEFAIADGFRFEGGSSLGILDRLAIIGDFNVASATGTTGTHGIITSSPVIHSGASSNDDYDPAGFVRCGSSIGISGFGEQGVAISGRGSMVANFIASCSNRKRGIYSEGGHIRCKFATANGNGEDGIISDVSGFIQAALSIASGNGLNGYWSTNASMLNASQSTASNNLQNGFEARGATRLAADVSFSTNNGAKGYLSTDGGMIDADSAAADGNTGNGFHAQSEGIIDTDNSSSTNNGDWGYEADVGGLIRASGSTASGNSSGDYNGATRGVMIDNTGAIQNFAWQATITPPVFNSVTVSTNNSTAEYKVVDDKTIFWKAIMDYSGLDTADISTLTLDLNLPFAMSGRFGGIQHSVRTSTGLILLATDTWHFEYNSITDDLVISDNAGALIQYNGGEIQAAGIIEISGWFESS